MTCLRWIDASQVRVAVVIEELSEVDLALIKATVPSRDLIDIEER